MNFVEALQAALNHPSPLIDIFHPEEGYAVRRNEDRTITWIEGTDMKSHVFLQDHKGWEIFDLYLATS